MLTLWSVKGGSGVTVAACALALTRATRRSPVLLVDLCGDVPAVLGQQEPKGPGLLGWLCTPDGSAEQLSRLVVDVHEHLSVLPLGATTRPLLRQQMSAAPDALARLSDEVIIDAGVDQVGDVSELAEFRRALRAAGRSHLVTKACYIALRRATASGAEADGVVVVLEPGRALDARDVSQTLDLPLAATVEVDPAVARSVDAGLLARRIPRRLERCLAALR